MTFSKNILLAVVDAGQELPATIHTHVCVEMPVYLLVCIMHVYIYTPPRKSLVEF